MKNIGYFILLSFFITAPVTAINEFQFSASVFPGRGPLSLQDIGFADGIETGQFSFPVSFDPNSEQSLGGFPVRESSFTIGGIVGGAFSNSDRISIANFDDSDVVTIGLNFVDTLTIENPGVGFDFYEFNSLFLQIVFSADTFTGTGITNLSSFNNPIDTSGQLSYRGSIALPNGLSEATNGSFRFGNISAIPEPATWLMMIVGFGVTGLALRRRERDQKAANF